MNKHTTGDRIADILAAAGLAISLLAIALGSARVEAGETATGKAALVATLGNQPIMSAVEWVVTNQSGGVVFEGKRHSASVTLAPGTYVARLHCNGLNLSRVFTVIAGSRSDVPVACDK